MASCQEGNEPHNGLSISHEGQEEHHGRDRQAGALMLTRDARGRQFGVSLADFDDWRSSSRTLSGLSLVFSGSFNVSDEGRIAEQTPGPTSRPTTSR